MNYRESRGVDFEKALKYITQGLDDFIDKVCSKNKNVKNVMSNWKNNILTKLRCKVGNPKFSTSQETVTNFRRSRCVGISSRITKEIRHRNG